MKMSTPMQPELAVILVPVLNRPHRVPLLMADVAAATPESHRLLFIAEEGDSVELEVLQQLGADHLVNPTDRGSYAKKINDGIAASTEPLIFTAADDLHFHPGWLSTAVAALTEQSLVIGTRDLLNPLVMAGDASTHTLVHRRYVAELGGTLDGGPGTLLHEGYHHEFPDVEMVEVAQLRGAFVMSEAVVEHLHPWGRKAPMDETYLKGRSFREADLATYKSRCPMWRREWQWR